jgi:hypothetical protein
VAYRGKRRMLALRKDREIEELLASSAIGYDQ